MNKEHIDESSAKHFLVCFALAVYSTELAVGCGIGKEVGDYKNYGHFCGWDLFFDTLGAAAGTAVRLILIRLVYGRWQYNWY